VKDEYEEGEAQGASPLPITTIDDQIVHWKTLVSSPRDEVIQESVLMKVFDKKTYVEFLFQIKPIS
jgi:hypothetical protein